MRALLAGALPHRYRSPNARPPEETALGFIAGILAGADKLARIGHLRGDPVLPELLEVKELPSQARLSRWLAIFDGPAKSLRCFRALWRWGLERLRAAGAATRSISIAPRCSTRTVVSRACVWDTRAWVSSPACSRSLPCSRK